MDTTRFCWGRRLFLSFLLAHAWTVKGSVVVDFAVENEEAAVDTHYDIPEGTGDGFVNGGAGGQDTIEFDAYGEVLAATDNRPYLRLKEAIAKKLLADGAAVNEKTQLLEASLLDALGRAESRDEQDRRAEIEKQRREKEHMENYQRQADELKRLQQESVRAARERAERERAERERAERERAAQGDVAAAPEHEKAVEGDLDNVEMWLTMGLSISCLLAAVFLVACCRRSDPAPQKDASDGDSVGGQGSRKATGSTGSAHGGRRGGDADAAGGGSWGDSDAVARLSEKLETISRAQEEANHRAAAEARAAAAEAKAAAAAEMAENATAAETARLIQLEAEVERLRFDNGTASMLLESQRSEMEDLRRSVLDLTSQVSDVRRSNSSFNVITGASERVRGLRQSNQDILRQSRQSLSNLRQSRNSFSGLANTPAKGMGAYGAANPNDANPPSNSYADPGFASPAVDHAWAPPLPRSATPPSQRAPVPPFVLPAQQSGHDEAEAAAGTGGGADGGSAQATGRVDSASQGGGGHDGESYGAAGEDDEGAYGVDMGSESGYVEYGEQSMSEYGEDDEAEMVESERRALMAAAEARFEPNTRTMVFVEGSIGIMFSGFSSFDIPCPEGAAIAVTHVFPGGQAADKGIRACDLIVALNGTALPESLTKDDFFDMLQDAPRPVAIGFRLQAAK